MAVDATAPLPTLTPESIKRRRKLAEMMLAQGLDVSPIASPWQGAARLAQSLMGGIEIGMADKEERQGQASAAEAVAKILAGEMGGTGNGTPVAAAAPAAAEPGNRSLPTFASDVTGGINQATAKYGLDPNYLPITAAIESGGNPNARNPRSSAGGLFQFINSTAGQYGLTNKFDPAASADAAARLAMDNKKALVAALGREPTPAELYLAHQQGAGGAAKLLANPDAPAVSIVGEKAVRLNGGSPNMTAAQFANKWLSKFNSYGPRTQVASANPGFVPMPYDPSNGAPAKTMPYDPDAQPQSGLAKPVQTAGLSIEAVPPQGIPTQAPEAPQTPVQPGSLPSMAGGGQAMQMPPEGLQQVAQAVTQQTARPEVRQAAQQAAQTPQGQQMIQQAQGAPIAAIMQALQNPWLNDGQRSLLMFVLKERMERSDPMRQLQMQKLQQDLAGGSPMEREKRQLEVEGARLNLEKTRRDLNMPNGELVKDDSGNVIGFFDKSTLQFKPIQGLPAAQGRKAPETKVVKQADGSEVAVQWNRETQAWEPMNAPQGGNPVTSPKLTEAQSKDVVFYNRGSKVLERMERQDKALTDVWSAVGGNMSNYLKSDAYRQAEQTGRELLAVILRKDTGAAITTQEMEQYGYMFLPKPGDDPTTIEQKRQARRVAIESIRMGLGSADAIFRAQEMLQGKPQPAPQAAQQGGGDWREVAPGVKMREKK